MGSITGEAASSAANAACWTVAVPGGGLLQPGLFDRVEAAAGREERHERGAGAVHSGEQRWPFPVPGRPAMTGVAGEVTDGLVVHGFTTERYLREVTLPALAEGAARAGRSRDDIEVTCPGFVVIDDEVLHTFAEIRRPRQAGAELNRRYGNIVDRVTVPRPAAFAPDPLRDLLSGLR
jgi:alkanesulfonate monooxygenase SsuD/methylene tetrahydromethanopterin reductase-like flavin-dependent oxidoreductase (luciferase family)